MKVRPLQDRVLVQRTSGEEKTAGGIIIPDSAKEKPQEGIIVATGRGKVRDDGNITPLDVAEGDRVLFGKYSGTDVTVNGEEYVILREEDILAVHQAQATTTTPKKKGK
jgi:chaperonin GroES